MQTERLWWITAPHFTAGLVTVEDRVMESAPILRWTAGKNWTVVRKQLQEKGFTVLLSSLRARM